MNFATSAAGYVKIEILDKTYRPIENYASCEIFGNTIDRKITFADGTDFSEFADKPVRLRFRLRDAKIYSMKFE